MRGVERVGGVLHGLVFAAMLAVVEPDKRQCQQGEALLLDLKGADQIHLADEHVLADHEQSHCLGEAAAPAAPAGEPEQQDDDDSRCAIIRQQQPAGTLTEHTGLRLLPGPFDSDDYAARLKSLYQAGHWSVWKYCIRRAWLADTGVRFWDDVRWAEDWPFDLMLLNHCTRLYFLDTVFTHYRVGRQGSLLTDAKNLPKRFDALAAAQRHLAAQAALGKIRPEVYAVMLDAAADVFWPQARTAAVKDAALRKACLPGLRRLRPLYPHGTEVQTRKDWKLFQTMMKTIGPRLTLWMASRR